MDNNKQKRRNKKTNPISTNLATKTHSPPTKLPQNHLTKNQPTSLQTRQAQNPKSPKTPHSQKQHF